MPSDIYAGDGKLQRFNWYTDKNAPVALCHSNGVAVVDALGWISAVTESSWKLRDALVGKRNVFFNK